MIASDAVGWGLLEREARGGQAGRRSPSARLIILAGLVEALCETVKEWIEMAVD
jgi:hypothetical protein